MRGLMMVVAAGGLQLACVPPAELTPSPESLDWGVVDFHNEECMDCACSDGCGAVELWVKNTGESATEVVMPNGFDDEHLCIQGTESAPNLYIGEAEPGESLLLRVSVCGYNPGELNLESELDDPRVIEGELRFSFDDGNLEVPFSFVPYREQ